MRNKEVKKLRIVGRRKGRRKKEKEMRKKEGRKRAAS